MPTLPEWYPRAIDHLTNLAKDKPLTRDRYDLAHRFITDLGWAGIRPSRIVHTAEGNIAIWLKYDPENKIRINVEDDETYTTSLTVRTTRETTHMEHQSLAVLMEYLREHYNPPAEFQYPE